MSTEPILISLKELAELFGVTAQTARRITQAGDFPAVIVLPPGRTLRWYRQEVLDWLAAQQRPRHTLDLGQATPTKARPGKTRAQRGTKPRKLDAREQALYDRGMERRNERLKEEAA